MIAKNLPLAGLAKTMFAALLVCVLFTLVACGSRSSSSVERLQEDISVQSVPSTRDVNEEFPVQEAGAVTEWPNTTANESEEETMMKNVFYIRVGSRTFVADFVDSDPDNPWRTLLQEGDLTVHLEDYSGFEKVGSLGRTLQLSQSWRSTKAGDIVLYQRDQVVLFYGSHAWEYALLGRVRDLSGWVEALGRGSIQAIFSLDP